MILGLSIKQSPHWVDYMTSLGWINIDTKCGAHIAIYKKFKVGSLVKIQRPPIMTAEDLEEIEDIVKPHKPLFIRIDPNYGQDPKLLEDKGYVFSYAPLSVPSTIYIDLEKSKEELWNNVSHSGKYSIHRAEREGFTVEFYKNPSDEVLKQHYDICKETAQRKHFYLQPYKELLIKRDLFGDESYLSFAFDKDHNLCSGKFYLAYKEIVTYLTGGTTLAGTKNKSGYDLLWKSILYFKDQGYKTFDLEGRDDPRFPKFTENWGGFSHFKEKFGGTDIVFPRPYIKYMNPGLKMLAKLTTLPL